MKTKRLLTLLLLVCGMTTGAWALDQDGEGYYLLGSVQDWQDFATKVETTPTANARMTADINLGNDQTKVGTTDNPYQGTFDGQGYALTMAYVETDGSSKHCAPFIKIQNATIQNLHVNGSITTAGMRPAGITSYISGISYVKNCWSEVDITSSRSGDIDAAGLVARVNQEMTLRIIDCVFTGSINYTNDNSYVTGGLVAWMQTGAKVYMDNCLFAPSYVRLGKNDRNYMLVGAYNGTATIYNSYYNSVGQASYFNSNIQGTYATDAQLADGTIAYMLQFNRTDLVWGQLLGTDVKPLLTCSESCRVYKALNGGYTNNPDDGYPYLQQDSDGNYFISSVQDWRDFATLVRIMPNANARMTADIDLDNDQTTIGNSTTPYQGTFDGQGHTLKVNLTATDDNFGPFFSIKNATIKNLHVTGTITTSKSYTGGIVGKTDGTTTLTNCRSSVTMISTKNGSSDIGGLVGITGDYSTLNMSDCLFDGAFNGVYTSDWGGFIGLNYYATTKIKNSLFSPASIYIRDNLYTFMKDYGGGTLTNCYTTVAGSTTQGTQATADELSNGTTTAALQNNRAETVWVQDPLTNQPMLALFAGKYKVPSSGLGTFSAKANFTLPEGLEAYYCKNYDVSTGTIAVVPIVGVVPAETGVLLRGTAGETYTLTISDGTPAEVSDNALVAVVEPIHVEQENGGYTNFMMSGGKFVRIAASSAETKMPANRAYLQILTSALPTNARNITISWDGETTEINIIGQLDNLQFDKKSNVWYDLQGRKIVKPSNSQLPKGIYINGGRKVVIK